MQTKTVRLSAKGQLAIPVGMRRAMGLRTGSELLVLFDGEKLLLTRADKAASTLLREFEDLVHASAETAKALWGSPADDVWDDA